MATISVTLACRFGPFELDLRTGDLRRNGRPVRLQQKPRSILLALLENPGEIVPRARLRERLWAEDTFVDFEDGLNTAMRKLREALGDDPQSPRYIETVRGQGYRFLAAVVPVALQEAAPEAEPGAAPPVEAAETAEPAASRVAADLPVPTQADSKDAAVRRSVSASRWAILLLCGALVLAVAGVWYWLTHSRPVLSFSSDTPILIADFDNQTGDPRFDQALSTALDVSLEQSRRVNIYSRLQTRRVLRLMGQKEDQRITPAVGREICQRENIPGLVAPGITRTGNEYLLTAQLIDPSTATVVRSYSEHVHNEDRILAALDSIATTIRRDLGESPLEIHQAHRPLPQVTTASLSALQEYADGAAQFSRGKPEDSVRLYKQAIAADPDFAVAHAALGYAYYSFYFNQPALGELEFREALALTSRTSDRERAWIEQNYAESQGRVSDALRLYQAYLQQYPGDWAARYSYARLLRMHGRARESLPIYDQVVRQSPDNAGLYIEIATAHSTLGEWQRSILAYEKAFSLDPGRLAGADINRAYGFTLVRNGQEDKAEQVFTALLADPASYAGGERSLAFLDLYRGHYASARRRLMLALAKSHDPYAVARIRYMLAVVADGEGNRSEQVAQLDRIMESFSSLGQKVAYGALVGQAYARAGEVGKARNLLTTIAPLVNERSEDQLAYIQLLKAEVAAASGDAKSAIEFLKPPAPNDSDSSAVLVREALAHIDEELGKADEAIQWRQQFVDSGNSGPLGWEPQQQLFAAYYALAQGKQRNGDRAGALIELAELLNRWRSADPGLPLLQNAIRLRRELVGAH